MDYGGDVVRFDGEAEIEGLHPPPARDPADLARESRLAVEGIEVLDQRIREGDVKGTVPERQRASIGANPLDPGWQIGRRRRQIDDGHFRDWKPQFRGQPPPVKRAAEIEDLGFLPNLKHAIEGAQAAWAEQPKDRIIERVNVHRCP
jgi:hypothetical protein